MKFILKKIIILYILLYSGFSFAITNNKEYSVLLDKDLSMKTGATALISGLNAYETLYQKLYNTNNVNFFYNFGFSFLNFTVAHHTMVIQHEIFGHGARLREFNIPAAYQIEFFGGGATYFSADAFNRLNLYEQAAVNTGGIEGNYIFSQAINNKFLKDEKITDTFAWNYLFSRNDQLNYILYTNYENNPGHDIANYITKINQIYGDNTLTKYDLQRKIFLDYLDPFWYYSLYSIGNNIISGHQDFNFPMFTFGKVKYLPGARLSLAPYGPETQFLNYIKYKDQIYKVILTYGNTKDNKSYAVTVKASNIYKHKDWSFGFNASLWNQPDMFTATPGNADNKFGAGFYLTSKYEIVKNINLLSEIGAKSKGFIPGEPLTSTPIIRLGINTDF